MCSRAAAPPWDRRYVDASLQPVSLLPILITHKLMTLAFLAVIYFVSSTRFFIPWADKTPPPVQSLLFRVFRNPREKPILPPTAPPFSPQPLRHPPHPLHL